MELTEHNNISPLYINVISVVITVNYCKSILLLYSPLTSYLYVHWILDLINIIIFVLSCS